MYLYAPAVSELLVSPVATAEFERTYPGEPARVRQVREDIGRVFGWCPMAQELVLVASELSTNAILHSRSGDGGQFTVAARIRYGDYIWIDVKDQGGTPERDSRNSFGKGLVIVDALAGEGNWGYVPRRHMAWARIPWPARAGRRR